MSIYVDTSALLAVLDADDKFHDAASLTWKKLIEEDEDLFINSFVLVELHALVQSRLGLEAVRTFFRDIYPILNIKWVDEEDYNKSITALLAANRRNLSLVDCSSFTTMIALDIQEVFAFDPHFAEQGFIVRPE